LASQKSFFWLCQFLKDLSCPIALCVVLPIPKVGPSFLEAAVWRCRAALNFLSAMRVLVPHALPLCL